MRTIVPEHYGHWQTGQSPASQQNQYPDSCISFLFNCAFPFFSVGATPVMATAAQDLVDGKKLNDELITQAVAAARNEIEAIADITNSAEAKQYLIGVLLERGLKRMAA